MKYKVVCAQDGFDDAVNAEIACGWEPVGGVSVFEYRGIDEHGNEEEVTTFAQAMVMKQDGSSEESCECARQALGLVKNEDSVNTTKKEPENRTDSGEYIDTIQRQDVWVNFCVTEYSHEQVMRLDRFLSFMMKDISRAPEHHREDLYIRIYPDTDGGGFPFAKIIIGYYRKETDEEYMLRTECHR